MFHAGVARIAATGFLAQSFGTMLPLAAYGVAMPTIERELATSRGVASLSVSAMMVALSITSLLAGGIIQRHSATRAMMIGAAACTFGYLLAPLATTIWQLVALYAFLIGPGACLLGPLTVSTMVSRMVDRRRSQMLAIANAPAFLLVAQPLAAAVLDRVGTTGLFFMLAGLSALLIPLAWTIDDRPRPAPAASRVSSSAGDDDARAAKNPSVMLGAGQLIASSRFWLLSLGVGAMTGIGSAYLTHAALIAESKGVAVDAASTLLTFYGVGAIAGALVFGWLADRLDPLAALLVNATMQAIAWLTFPFVGGLTAMWICSLAIGAGMGSLVALHSAAINAMFGVHNLPRAMGMSYFLKLPFLMSAAPLAGYLFDLHKNYEFAVVFFGGAIAISAAIFLRMRIGWANTAV